MNEWEKKQKKNELNRAPFDEGNEADTSGVKCRSSFSSSASASASASASSLFQPFRRGLVGLALVWLFYYGEGGRRRKKNAVEQQQQKKL